MHRNIVCIGAGYIGGPTMAVIAAKNPDRIYRSLGFNALSITKNVSLSVDNRLSEMLSYAL